MDNRHLTALSRAAGAPRLQRTLVLLLLAVLVLEVRGNWPAFRGQGAAGQATGPAPPLIWDVTTGRNIAWQTPLPGLGLASPVIWEEQIYVTTAVSESGEALLKPGRYGDITPVNEGPQRWLLLCLDRRTGQLRWQRQLAAGQPPTQRHPKSSHANPTPATNGEFVVTVFSNGQLSCCSNAGELVWQRDLGKLDSGYFKMPSAQWGFGSSPVIHEGRVIVQCDVLRTSYLAAFELRTGKEVWRTERGDLPTWSTPTVAGGQIICNGYRRIGGYDLVSGEPLWWLRGGGDIPVPTPIAAYGLAFITNAHGSMSPIYAVPLTARGELSPERDCAWFERRRGSYLPTPVVAGEYLYIGRDDGIVSCFRARTGEQLFQQRLTDDPIAFTASPIAIGDKVLFTAETGEVFVVASGPELVVTDRPLLQDVCLTTPAAAHGMLLFRTRSKLVAIAGE